MSIVVDAGGREEPAASHFPFPVNGFCNQYQRVMTSERVIVHPQFTSKVDGEAGDVSKDVLGQFPAVKEGGSALPALLPTSFHHGNQVKWRRRPIIPDLADAPRPSFPYLSLSAHVLFSGSQSVLPPRNDTGRRRRLRSRRHSRRSPSSKRVV